MLTEAVAPRIVSIDSNGVTRAELGVSNEDSAHLRLMDRGGNERVRLDAGLGNRGPCFFFKDLHEKHSSLSVRGMNVQRSSICGVETESYCGRRRLWNRHKYFLRLIPLSNRMLETRVRYRNDGRATLLETDIGATYGIHRDRP
jgi:hypothetical protein